MGSSGIWVKLAADVLIVFGLLFVVEVLIGTAGIMGFFADLVIWPLDGAQSLAAAETRLLLSIAGGVMIGWGVTILYVAGPVAAHDPALARRIILISMLCWFVPDSLGSIAAGGWVNVIGNCGLLAMFLIPVLRMPRRAAVPG